MGGGFSLFLFFLRAVATSHPGNCKATNFCIARPAVLLFRAVRSPLARIHILTLATIQEVTSTLTSLDQFTGGLGRTSKGFAEKVKSVPPLSSGMPILFCERLLRVGAHSVK